jgi:hypothetical protein
MLSEAFQRLLTRRGQIRPGQFGLHLRLQLDHRVAQAAIRFPKHGGVLPRLVDDPHAAAREHANEQIVAEDAWPGFVAGAER